MSGQPLVLTLSCPDRPGIVAAVSAFLFAKGQNILDAQQFDDVETGRFFMRVVFEAATSTSSLDQLRAGFRDVGAEWQMEWQIRDSSVRRRVMLLVSRLEHCLVNLIYRWRIGDLAMKPTAVVSNHPQDAHNHLQLGDVPFHHLPVTAATKSAQEAQLWQLIEST